MPKLSTGGSTLGGGRRSRRASCGRSRRGRDARDLRRLAGRDRLHDLLLRRLPSRSKTPTLRPRRSTVIRSATSKTSCRLCEMSTTARPCSREPLDELEHLLGLRDAERRGRLVEDDEPRVPHHRARDRDRLALAAGERRDRLPDRADRRHARALFSVSAVRCSITGSLSRWKQVVRLAAEDTCSGRRRGCRRARGPGRRPRSRGAPRPSARGS